MSELEMSLAEIQDTARSCFLANGCDELNADSLARTISAAEADGSISHGLFRVPGYVASLRTGKVNGRARPEEVHLSSSAIRLDGNRGFAPLTLEHGLPLVAQETLVGSIVRISVKTICYIIVPQMGGVVVVGVAELGR